MKRLLFLLAFSAIFDTTVWAQDYHPLLNQTTWIVTHSVACCVPHRTKVYTPEQDVTIEGHIYTPYRDRFPQYDSDRNLVPVVYLREDVVNKRVYKLLNGVEMLLYDFNFQVGDTITQPGFSRSDLTTYTWTVILVDEIQTNVGLRKRIKLSSRYLGRSIYQVWIEGVGSNKHPFYPQHNYQAVMSGSGGNMVNTNCVYQNNEHVYGNNNCETLLSAVDNMFTPEKITFSPNPFRTSFTIHSDLSLQEAIVKLYNMQGQLVCERYFSGAQVSINIENLAKGLYFAELFENHQLIKTAKLVVN